MTLLHLDVGTGAQHAEPVVGWGGPLAALLGVAAATLPARFFSEPVRAGVHRGAILDRAQFDAALAALRQRWREPAWTEGVSA